MLHNKHIVSKKCYILNVTKKKIPTNMSCVSVLILILSVSFLGRMLLCFKQRIQRNKLCTNFNSNAFMSQWQFFLVNEKKNIEPTQKIVSSIYHFQLICQLTLKFWLSKRNHFLKYCLHWRENFKNIEHFWLKSWRWLFYYTEWVKIGPVWLKSTRPTE